MTPNPIPAEPVTSERAVSTTSDGPLRFFERFSRVFEGRFTKPPFSLTINTGCITIPSHWSDSPTNLIQGKPALW